MRRERSTGAGMYQKFYGLKTKPFHITPDLFFLFMSSKHKLALDCMEFGLLNNAGIILITGDIGTGKTTTIRRLHQDLGKEIKPACIFNTNLDPEQFLALVLHEFGVEADPLNKSRNIHVIQQTLQQMRGAGQRPLLIVDDAQNLTFAVLQEVRWLSGLQDENGMLVQIILAGQPELKARLAHPTMASLNQRIGISVDLGPFTREESEAYILHRLKKAGRRKPLFSTAALDAIYTVTGGTPRTINLLCDHALVYGFADGRRQIDAPIVEQVVGELGGYGVGFSAPSGTRPPLDAGDPPTGGQTAQGEESAAPGVLLPRIQQLEGRLDQLERMIVNWAGELQQTLRDQLAEERRRSERLTLLIAGASAARPEEPADPPAPIALAAQKKGGSDR